MTAPVLIERGIYEVRSRNLTVAAYDGSGGFTGIREKLGSRYLFTEYLRDGPGALGTVTPVRQVATLLPGIPVQEQLDGQTCGNCGLAAWWTGPPAPAPWECDGGCAKPLPRANCNQALFTVLKQVEGLIQEEEEEEYGPQPAGS